MSPKDRLNPNNVRILELLQREGRASYARIDAAAGMSAPSAHERVSKLETRGIVTGYAALVDTRDLERVIHRIQAIDHVYATETEVVFSTAFERRPLALRRETGGSGEA